MRCAVAFWQDPAEGFAKEEFFDPAPVEQGPPTHSQRKAVGGGNLFIPNLLSTTGVSKPTNRRIGPGAAHHHSLRGSVGGGMPSAEEGRLTTGDL
eukprot:9491112-Pyramimonas_sp.AAC.1